jgi:hypothetical protein
LSGSPPAVFADNVDMRDAVVRQFETFDPHYRERRQHYDRRQFVWLM